MEGLRDTEKLDPLTVYVAQVEVPAGVSEALAEGYRLDLQQVLPQLRFPLVSLVPALVSLASLVWWWFASIEADNKVYPILLFAVAGAIAATMVTSSRWWRDRQRRTAPVVIEKLLPPEQAVLESLIKPLLAIEALDREIGGLVDVEVIRSETLAVKPRLLESSRRRAATQEPSTIRELDDALASISSRVAALVRIRTSLARSVHELREELAARQLAPAEPVDELRVATATDPHSRSYLEQVADELEGQGP